MDIDNREEIIELFDIYGNLLTEKQQTYFKDYYFFDLSFSEIAENYEISRNAVFDQIKKAIANLCDIDSKLCLKNKFVKIKNAIDDETLKAKIEAIIEE